MERLRTVWTVGLFDFLESIRSRKAAALLVLYLLGSIASTIVFVRVLAAVEKSVARQLRVAETTRPGTMTAEVLRNEQLLDVVDELVGERELAKSIVSMPILAIFYAAIALTFIPLLVTLTSGDAISAEVSSGSCRYALFRSDRLSWAVGKLFGQTLLMTCGILLGALGAWLVGLFTLAEYPAAATGWWMLRFSGLAWCYGFAYLGLALGTSQLARSVNVTRGLALVGLFAFALCGNVLESEWIVDRWAPTLAPTVGMLFPQAHDLDLWRPALADRLPSLVMLPALGILYFAVGYQRFSRRDR